MSDENVEILMRDCEYVYQEQKTSFVGHNKKNSYLKHDFVDDMISKS